MNTNVTNIQLFILICHFLPNKIVGCAGNLLFSSSYFHLFTDVEIPFHICEEIFPRL